MEAPVIVLSDADFQAWVAAETGLSANPVDRGQKWYTTYGCKACHSVDGTQGVGPTWKGVYGHQVSFTDGTSGTVDDAYLFEAIRNPAARIVQGFQPVMPANIAEKMTDDQIRDVIEFIKTLK
jgi:cytochrome c oxidase subunit 2